MVDVPYTSFLKFVYAKHKQLSVFLFNHDDKYKMATIFKDLITPDVVDFIKDTFIIEEKNSIITIKGVKNG